MKKVKWYSLPAMPTLLIVIAGTVLLVLAFTRETGAFLRYFSYLLSTYALIIGVSGLARFFRRVSRSIPDTRVMKKLHTNTHAARYLDDPFFRTEINLYFGTAVNALYIFIKFFTGVYLRSGWLMLGVSGLAASIIILSISIYMILHATKKIGRLSS